MFEEMERNLDAPFFLEEMERNLDAPFLLATADRFLFIIQMTWYLYTRKVRFYASGIDCELREVHDLFIDVLSEDNFSLFLFIYSKL